MRAAAATAIAFLACHPIGAKGDECMWGPYREALLEAGALTVLLEAALAPTEDDNCRKVIEKAAAVGVMYLCTVVSSRTYLAHHELERHFIYYYYCSYYHLHHHHHQYYY